MTINQNDKQDLTAEAEYFDYSSASNPLLEKLITPTPYHIFTPEFLHQNTSGILPLDLSKDLGCDYPATGPALLANFVRIVNESVTTNALATSQVFYVFKGSGYTEAFGRKIPWEAGDYMVFPAHGEAVHHCEGEASFYWVHDGPLMSYLGVTAMKERFAPTLYKHSIAAATLQQIANDPKGKLANRLSVLLANKNFPQTRTVTHTMWTMFGLLPKGAIQYPHRHESIALDFAIDCQPGCYTMIGTALGPDGMIANGKRHDWVPGAAFVTPAGYWHSHHNESEADAHVLPIQDAGLHTYLRTLEITFSHPDNDGTCHISQRP
jgi:gentisate 1,2-dioxygenase